MYEFIEADEFSSCMKKIKDRVARDAINERVAYARLGHLGKLLKGTGGISEMVVDMGPGYRLYYCRGTDGIYWLLVAGVKKNQAADIKRAMAIHKSLKARDYA